MFEDAGDINNLDPDDICELPGSSAARDAVARQQGMSGLGAGPSNQQVGAAIGAATGSLTDFAQAVGGSGVAAAQARLQALRQRGQISQAQFQAQMAQLQKPLGGSFLSRNKWWIILGIAVIGGGVWWYRRRRAR